jgi:hypothetical protein
MKDGENFDDIVLVEEVDREWEPPHKNTASVQKDAYVGQWGFRRPRDRRIQFEKELDTWARLLRFVPCCRLIGFSLRTRLNVD